MDEKLGMVRLLTETEHLALVKAVSVGNANSVRALGGRYGVAAASLAAESDDEQVRTLERAARQLKWWLPSESR